MTILCLVGTNPYPFERLVSYVDNVLGPIHDVVIQLGNTPYSPNHSDSFKFRSRSEIIDLIIKADLVITQGGFGSVSDALSCNRKLIAVPRLIELNECLDDQMELVDYYASEKYLIACYDVKNIESIIERFNNGTILLREYVPKLEQKVKDLVQKHLEFYLT